MGRVLRFVGFASVVTWGASAFAQSSAGGDVTAAAAAFQQAQQAQLMRDFARAADLFELADRTAPSPAALRSAIRNHQAAGHPARAATLALYAGQRDPSDPLSAQLSIAVRAELAARLVWVRVRCSSACGIAVDGLADAGERRPEHSFYVDPGNHALTVSFEGRESVRQSIEGAAGSQVERSVEAPAAEAPRATQESGGAGSAPAAGVVGSASPTGPRVVENPPRVAPVAGARENDPRGALTDRPSQTGVRPTFFAVGAGATVVLGGALLWSGLDTLRARDAYVADPSEARFLEGRGLELRTNVLLGATVVVGAATAVLGVFTQWRAPESVGRARVAAWVGSDRGDVLISGVF